jgi:hypothetical protein
VPSDLEKATGRKHKSPLEMLEIFKNDLGYATQKAQSFVE